jgi:transaldolase/glucose-6-phosphate isomerase
MGAVQQTRNLGQSIWLDYIRRDLIESGELSKLAGAGEICGVTSNPSIFQNAISGSELYSSDIRRLVHAGWSPEKIFDRIAIDDIRAATDVFLPLYERTNGLDGYVSIEVNPELANDTESTLNEAHRLWGEVNRPNVMIKIPATKAGIPAIEAAIDTGINVNVTLIFSLDRYAEVMEAYLRGLESRHARGEAIGHIASVASFFISRVDSAVDARLNEIIRREGSEAERATSLLGKAAIANAKLAYAQFEGVFYTERFKLLEEAGARFQRPLWASTSTKDPAYPDTYYVDTLIGMHTVNTVPQKTLEAFRDHGVAQATLREDISGARAQIQAIEALGISLEQVTADLEKEGVEKFAAAYTGLLQTLEDRASNFRIELAPLLIEIGSAMERLASDEVGRRVWGNDPSLWTTKSDEIDEVRNRTGWLNLPQSMQMQIVEIQGFAEELRDRGIRQAVLMAMGGSSLAADVLRRTLEGNGGFDLIVLDSTDPETIASVEKAVDYEATLFIVGSKSGGTAEPLRMLDLFWARAAETLGERAHEHFVALTDPGSHLEDLARERNFLKVISTPSDVGGRYSALTPFGLFPGALLELDLSAFLLGADKMARASGPNVPIPASPGMYLGAVLGAAHQAGRDKVTFLADPELGPFSDWIEQLVAESSGKAGIGITPIVGEPVGSGESYSEDRLLVYLRSSGKLDRRMNGWQRAGLPILVLDMVPNEAGLGSAFFQWEFGVAVACHLIGVNAFNQPNVQSAKSATLELLKRYERKGDLPKVELLWEDPSLTLRGGTSEVKQKADSLEDVLTIILEKARDKGGLGFLLYLPQNPGIEKTLTRTRRVLRDQLGLATLHGFGPRYLHSTGQLHKGGANHAVYLVVTSDRTKDVAIPGFDYGFQVLQEAQAVGDIQALKQAGRTVLHVQLKATKHLKAFFSTLQEIASGLTA